MVVQWRFAESLKKGSEICLGLEPSGGTAWQHETRCYIVSVEEPKRGPIETLESLAAWERHKIMETRYQVVHAEEGQKVQGKVRVVQPEECLRTKRHRSELARIWAQEPFWGGGHALTLRDGYRGVGCIHQ